MDSYSYFVFVKCNGPKAKLLSIDKKIEKKKLYEFKCNTFGYEILHFPNG